MLRFHLHGFRMTTHRLYAKASNQPDGFPGDESLYVFAANERNVLPKAASELVDQPTPVSIFFGFHLFEDFSCCGVVVPHARCKVSIDPAICFFVRTSQGKDFRFWKIFDVLSDTSIEATWLDDWCRFCKLDTHQHTTPIPSW